MIRCQGLQLIGVHRWVKVVTLTKVVGAGVSCIIV